MHMSVQNIEVDKMPIPVAAGSEAWDGGRSLAGIAVSSLARYVDVGLLCCVSSSGRGFCDELISLLEVSYGV
jgi:hypothetical protein